VERVILDTSVLIDPVELPEDVEAAISAVSIAELHFRFASRRRHHAPVASDETGPDRIALHAAAAGRQRRSRMGRLQAAVASRDANPRKRTADLAIAATANVHNATLLTRNLKDFTIHADLGTGLCTLSDHGKVPTRRRVGDGVSPRRQPSTDRADNKCFCGSVALVVGDRIDDPGVAASLADRPESAGDVVSVSATWSGAENHRPVTGRELTQVPIRISEPGDARVSLCNQLSHRGDGHPAAAQKITDRRTPGGLLCSKPQR